tara:strand:+ start:1091 stop:1711 length:621 start_codon:yes stop_codon:yes gene_type:complete
MALVKLNNRGVRSVSTFGSISSLGTYTFIKKVTASSSANVAFVNGSSDVVLDGTYKEYLFTFNNIHAATDDVMFTFNGSDDTSSHSYDIAKTTSFFTAENSESGSNAFTYSTSGDLAQGTGYQRLFNGIGNVNDESCAGYLHLFEPSSTTYVKHFIGMTTGNRQADANGVYYVAGYFNTTSAITAIDFKVHSGNIESGDFCLYGIN